MRRKHIKVSDEKLKECAHSWLTIPNLKWSELARKISPSLRGFSLKRRCVIAGLVPKVARGFSRCNCCKEIKQVSKFATNALCQVCEHSRDYKRLKREAEALDEASKSAMKFWSEHARKTEDT